MRTVTLNNGVEMPILDPESVRRLSSRRID